MDELNAARQRLEQAQNKRNQAQLEVALADAKMLAAHRANDPRAYGYALQEKSQATSALIWANHEEARLREEYERLLAAADLQTLQQHHQLTLAHDQALHGILCYVLGCERRGATWCTDCGCYLCKEHMTGSFHNYVMKRWVPLVESALTAVHQEVTG